MSPGAIKKNHPCITKKIGIILSLFLESTLTCSVAIPWLSDKRKYILNIAWDILILKNYSCMCSVFVKSSTLSLLWVTTRANTTLFCLSHTTIIYLLDSELEGTDYVLFSSDSLQPNKMPGTNAFSNWTNNSRASFAKLVEASSPLSLALS